MGAVLIVILTVGGAVAGDVMTIEFKTAGACVAALDRFSTRSNFVSGSCIDQVTGDNIASVD